MTDTLHKNPESCKESDTPETDAVLAQYKHHWSASEIMAEVARRLERERDEARFDLAFRRDLYKLQEERVKELEAEVKLWKENATSNKHVSNFVERERDEAVNSAISGRGGTANLLLIAMIGNVLLLRKRNK